MNACAHVETGSQAGKPIVTAGCGILLWFQLSSSDSATLMGMHLHFVYDVWVLITDWRVQFRRLSWSWEIIAHCLVAFFVFQYRINQHRSVHLEIMCLIFHSVFIHFHARSTPGCNAGAVKLELLKHILYQ